MALEDIPLFSMLRSRLGYLAERQRLIAENVANADTPNYVPRDLRPFTLPQASTLATSAAANAAAGRTGGGFDGPRGAARQMSGGSRSRTSAWQPVDAPDSETTMNGNRVVLEEQMMHMSETRIEFDAAIGFYQKSLNLLRMAARRPGA